jgi:hypothetical protein
MLLSVFHFYYLGILRLAILLLRTFHRMAHTWKYGARTSLFNIYLYFLIPVIYGLPDNRVSIPNSM